MITKVCTKCKRDLPIDMFHKYVRRKDTHYSSCKECKSKYKKENKEKLLLAQTRRRKNNSDYATKVIAWNKVYYELSRGNITKPDTCSVCGNPAEIIQGHHDDYSKPLDIKWCCQSCHVVLDEQRRTG